MKYAPEMSQILSFLKKFSSFFGILVASLKMFVRKNTARKMVYVYAYMFYAST